jgi:hypothetical protein
MKATRWPALIGLLLSLMTAGCANDGAASDNAKNTGFYGGASGGWSHP